MSSIFLYCLNVLILLLPILSIQAGQLTSHADIIKEQRSRMAHIKK
ncbi:hypothetical protein KSF78_0008482 [Schistosoma japonicum]|nr:hypothetical protein KSF78_0008482 [Schistosoma japonicum]KAH8874713.1 hypothetical protein KSF78_0008482 [Schistosoma japonicum]